MARNAQQISVYVAAWGLILATIAPLQAAPWSPWIYRYTGHLLHFVANDAESASASAQNGTVETKPYCSRILKDENTIVLKGRVPSESDVKILQGVIAATSPGATLIDKTQIDAGARQRDVWLAAMTFALRQLAKLDHGSVTLNDNLFSLDGMVKASDNLQAFEQRFVEELPKGVVLQQLALKPSVDQVPLWVAQMHGGNLALSGYVPKDYDQALVAYAQATYKNVQVSSVVPLGGSGSPEWIEAAKLAMDMLKLLKQGNATVREKTITVEGIYLSQDAAAVMKALDGRLPRGFRIETNVREASSTLARSGSELNLAVREDSLPFTP